MANVTFDPISQGGNLSRITGLDPSGPLFYSVSTSDRWQILKPCIKCHFHIFCRLDSSDAQFVDIIHTAGYWVHIEQCWNGSMISLLLFISGGDIDTKWSCGHLAKWRQSTSTRMREKVFLLISSPINISVSNRYLIFQRISWSLLQSFSCVETLLRVNTDNSEGKWTQWASCWYVSR